VFVCVWLCVCVGVCVCVCVCDCQRVALAQSCCVPATHLCYILNAFRALLHFRGQMQAGHGNDLRVYVGAHACECERCFILLISSLTRFLSFTPHTHI
jgi:hypothetical protein